MAGVGMIDVYQSPAERAPNYHPSEHYRSCEYKGVLYGPIKFRKNLFAPKNKTFVLHLPATNPVDERIDE